MPKFRISLSASFSLQKNLCADNAQDARKILLESHGIKFLDLFNEDHTIIQLPDDEEI